MSQVPSSLPPCVPPLGALSAATRVANAEAKSKGTVMLLTNFVLIIVVFLSLFLAFLASHRGRSHLAVHSFLRKILPGVAKTKILSGDPPKPTRVRASIMAKAQRSARASSCRGSASPINGIKRYARRRFGRPANAHRPLTTMVPLMVPLVSPVSRFEHWSVVKLPLAPANRPVPPIMVQGSTWRRSPLAHKPLLIPKKHAKMLSPLAASPTIKRLPPGFPGGVFAKANSTGIE